MTWSDCSNRELYFHVGWQPTAGLAMLPDAVVRHVADRSFWGGIASGDSQLNADLNEAADAAAE